MIKLVIFDLDDTLVSEYDYIKSGYKKVSEHICSKYGIDSRNVYDELLELFDKKTKNVFNVLLEKHDIKYSQKDIMELVTTYREHVPSINFYDDVLPFLDKLKSKSIKVGIISDGYLESQRNKINVLGANDIFDYIILTDELGKEFWKPSLKPFGMMRDKFGFEYDEMIYIGDNPQKDFYIKKYFNIKTVRIVRKNAIYKNAEYLEDIKEDIRINTLTEEIL